MVASYQLLSNEPLLHTPYAFGKAFKRLARIAPGEYRKQRRLIDIPAARPLLPPETSAVPY